MQDLKSFRGDRALQLFLLVISHFSAVQSPSQWRREGKGKLVYVTSLHTSAAGSSGANFFGVDSAASVVNTYRPRDLGICQI